MFTLICIIPKEHKTVHGLHYVNQPHILSAAYNPSPVTATLYQSVVEARKI
jgi:hypothetical protein